MTMFLSNSAKQFFAFLNTKIDQFNEGVRDMGFIKENDGFDLFGNDGQFVQTYSRKRDAVRGATRRGIVLNG